MNGQPTRQPIVFSFARGRPCPEASKKIGNPARGYHRSENMTAGIAAGPRAMGRIQHALNTVYPQFGLKPVRKSARDMRARL
jgi:hypothetical protein